MSGTNSHVSIIMYIQYYSFVNQCNVLSLHQDFINVIANHFHDIIALSTTIQVFPIWSQIAQFITESPKGILALTKSWLKIIQETWQVNLLLRASLQKQFLCSDCFHRGLVLAAAVFAHGINMSLPWAAKKMATVFSNCICQLYFPTVFLNYICQLYWRSADCLLMGLICRYVGLPPLPG